MQPHYPWTCKVECSYSPNMQTRCLLPIPLSRILIKLGVPLKIKINNFRSLSKKCWDERIGEHSCYLTNLHNNYFESVITILLYRDQFVLKYSVPVLIARFIVMLLNLFTICHGILLSISYQYIFFFHPHKLSRISCIVLVNSVYEYESVVWIYNIYYRS